MIFSLSLEQGYSADGKINIGVLDIGKLGGDYKSKHTNTVHFSANIAEIGIVYSMFTHKNGNIVIIY